MTEVHLPEEIGVFPLSGVLLLPGMWLPLHVFEPRYRHLVADALAGDNAFGMIQPTVPRQDNRPAPGSEQEHPELYTVGCLGRIARAQETADGRYMVTLEGVSRFRVQEELDLHQGYRRVRVSYDGYADDPAEAGQIYDASRIMEAVARFAEANQVEMDLSQLRALPGIQLLNGLAMSLPFKATEKQALLEAPDPEEREELLLSLLSMGMEPADEDAAVTPPTFN